MAARRRSARWPASARASAAPRVPFPMMLAGLSAWHAEHAQVVIVGPAGPPRTRVDALQREVARRYRPFASRRAGRAGGRQEALAALMPFVGAMRLRDGRATAYVCRAFTCREPVTDADAAAQRRSRLELPPEASTLLISCAERAPYWSNSSDAYTTLKSSCASATTRSPSSPSPWQLARVVDRARRRRRAEVDAPGHRSRQEPRRRGAHRSPARVQLDCRADRRRRGDRDGDSERRCRCRALRHRAAPARRDDHADPRRGARSEARRALSASGPASARTKTESFVTKLRRLSSRHVAVLPTFSRYRRGIALALSDPRSRSMFRRDHEITVSRAGSRRR